MQPKKRWAPLDLFYIIIQKMKGFRTANSMKKYLYLIWTRFGTKNEKIFPIWESKKCLDFERFQIQRSWAPHKFIATSETVL